MPHAGTGISRQRPFEGPQIFSARAGALAHQDRQKALARHQNLRHQPMVGKGRKIRAMIRRLTSLSIVLCSILFAVPSWSQTMGQRPASFSDCLLRVSKAIYRVSDVVEFSLDCECKNSKGCLF